MRARNLFVYVVAVLLRSRTSGSRYSIRALQLACGIALLSSTGIGIAAAEPLAAAIEGKGNDKDGKQESVFVAGSHIPKRIQVKANGTNTVQPLRVYTRAEIERTGRFTAAGILAQDPSVTIGTTAAPAKP